jgi:TetR/AcrR family transcriptional repressor of mexJK operon
MSPPPKRNANTATMILDAAKGEFSTFGFKKVTMDEIARELDMGKASLYYYFRTKEELFGAVITREHELFMETVERRIADVPSAGEKIKTFVAERTEYFNRLVHLNVLDHRTAAAMKPIFAKLFEAFSREELKLLRAIILEGRKNGEFRVPSEEKVAEALLHTLQGLRLRFVRFLDAPRMGPKDYDRLKKEQRFVTDMILRGIKK